MQSANRLFQLILTFNTNRRDRPRLPILNQSQLIGILYLENNLNAGVLPDRLQVLKLLMIQAAISWKMLGCMHN